VTEDPFASPREPGPQGADGRTATGEVSATGRELAPTWFRVIVFIWSGQAFSIVTSYAATYAAIWHITATTNSALMLSLTTMFSLLPTGLLSPFAGVLADRVNRRTMMLLADAATGLVSAALGVAIWLDQLSLPLLMALLALRACAQAFHAPAMTAAMPMLVPDRHLLRVNSLDQMLWSGAAIGAPALGILFYTSIGFQWVMFLDTAGAGLACLGLALVRVPTVRDESMTGQHIFKNMVDGFRVIRSNRGLFWLMAFCTLAMIFFMPIGSLFPLMTYQHFGLGGYHASITEAVWGVAMLVGSGVLLAWGGGRRHVRLVIFSGMALGVTIAVCGVLPPTGFWAFAALTGVMGAVASFYNGPLTTVVQRHTPEEKMGRVMGLFGSILSLTSPIGLIISGFAAERTGIATWFLICGVLMSAVTAAALLVRPILALDNPPAE
jgi:DHA3 family macrolide efflux protein-like MFS transporter